VATLAVALLSAAAGAARYFFNIKLPLATSSGLTLILIGNALTLYRKNVLTKQTFIWLAGTCFGLLGLTNLLGYAKDWGHQENPWRFIDSTIVAAALFLYAESGRKFDFAWLRWLGAISYSLYLFHMPFADLSTRFGSEHPSLSRCAFVLVAVGVAWLVYRFVEIPCQAHGKVLAAKVKR